MKFEDMTPEQQNEIESLFRLRCLKLGDKVQQRHIEDIKLLLGVNPPMQKIDIRFNDTGKPLVVEGANLIDKIVET